MAATAERDTHEEGKGSSADGGQFIDELVGGGDDFFYDQQMMASLWGDAPTGADVEVQPELEEFLPDPDPFSPCVPSQVPGSVQAASSNLADDAPRVELPVPPAAATPKAGDLGVIAVAKPAAKAGAPTAQGHLLAGGAVSPKRRRIEKKRQPKDAADAYITTMTRADSAVHAFVVASLREYHDLDAYWRKRQYWALRWIKSRPKGFFARNATYPVKWAQACAEYKQQTPSQIAKSLCRWAVDGVTPGVRGAPVDSSNATKDHIRVTAAIVNWNVPPCEDEKFGRLWEHLKTTDPESAEYDALLSEIQALEVVAEAWPPFLDFARKFKREAQAGELSCCMELSLHADKPRWHFHLVVSNLRVARTNRAEGVVVLYKSLLNEFAPSPVLRCTLARGKNAESAGHRMHCYGQWCKIGSLYRYDDFPRGYEFVCKAGWTLAAWQMRKLTTKEVTKEIIFNRDSVSATLQKIREVTEAEIEQWMRSEKAKAIQEIEAPGSLRAFRKYPQVNMWRAQYLKAKLLRSREGEKITRFKFLVLCGDSRFGKTRFACSLYGCPQTYVAQCQGVTQPSLAGFDPRRDRCIVLDEPSPDLVDSCKVFLQASLEGSELYQSPTQRFTRWVWVYAVPIIICTNDWIHEKDNSPLARWIRENQVFVNVTSPMFET